MKFICLFVCLFVLIYIKIEWLMCLIFILKVLDSVLDPEASYLMESPVP